MKTVRVYRDQAVWEREYLSVEVPDDAKGEDLVWIINEKLDKGDYAELCPPEVLCEVDSMDTITMLPIYDDKEI